LGMTRGEIRKKFDEIVAFAEVEKFLDTPVKRYSSGMYVRLAFAVAAHLEPEILIVDEVLAVGDAQFQKKCLGKMQDVTEQQGRTVLFVSHNMTAIKSFCQRAILLQAGTISMEGSPYRVVDYYSAHREKNRQIAWGSADDAPGNGLVWLKEVQILPSDGENDDSLTVNDPIDIAVDYWNSVADLVLNVSLVIYTAEDICVLNTGSDAQPRPYGLNRAVCHIPGGLLNDENYRVRILLIQDASLPLCDRDHLITFKIQDTNRSGGWQGKWVGVVRPRLEWSTSLLQANQRMIERRLAQ